MKTLTNNYMLIVLILNSLLSCTITLQGQEDKHYCTGVIIDYDSNKYSMVKIGNQCWMAENLKSRHYSNGDKIIGAYAYNNKESYIYCYGLLYTWDAVTRGKSSDMNPSWIQGVCPNGWHVPSDNEWKELELTIGMTKKQADTLTKPEHGHYFRQTHDEGQMLKANDYKANWTRSNEGTSGTDIYGFSVLPGGGCSVIKSVNNKDTVVFENINISARFWTSTFKNVDNRAVAVGRVFYHEFNGIERVLGSTNGGYSVRCLKD